jgi:HEAT repeat protein
MPNNAFACVVGAVIAVFPSSASGGDKQDARVEQLVKDLADDSDQVRRNAAERLGEIGAAAKKVVPALTGALKDLMPQVRIQAAVALWKIDKRLDAATMRLLADAAESGDQDVSTSAYAALVTLGESAAGPLADLLKDENRRVRERAAQLLGRLGPKALPAVAALVKAHSDPNARMRLEAANALAAIGPGAKEAVAALAANLKDKDRRVVIGAALALWSVDGQEDKLILAAQALLADRASERLTATGGIAAAGTKAVPVFVKALRHEKAEVRLAALKALAVMPAQASGAFAEVAAVLADKDDAVRRQAAQTLAGLAQDPTAIPKLLDLLNHTAEAMRGGAATALRLISRTPAGLPKKQAEPGLVKAVKDPSALVRVQAAGALRTLGDKDKVAQAVLLAALTDKDSLVRRLAVTGLDPINLDEKKISDALTEVLRDNDLGVKIRAAYALGNSPFGSLAPVDDVWSIVQAAAKDADPEHRQLAIGPLLFADPRATDKAVALLVAALSDKYATLRISAIDILGAIKAKTAIPRLTELLRDEDAVVRAAAADALAKMGAEAAAAVPALIQALADEEVRVRLAAVAALGNVDPSPKTVTVLLNALVEDNSRVRRLCVVTLSRAARRDKETLAAVVAALQDADPAVRVEAIEAVRQAGVEGKPAVAALARIVQTGGEDEAKFAAFALGNLAAEAAAAVPALTAVVKSRTREAELRGLAAQALGDIGPAAAPAVPALTEALKDKEEYVRRLSALALGGIGAAAKEAVPQLQSLLKDQNGSVRKAAAKALKLIEGR